MKNNIKLSMSLKELKQHKKQLKLLAGVYNIFLHITTGVAMTRDYMPVDVLEEFRAIVKSIKKI